MIDWSQCSAKERIFLLEYLIDFNAARAARAAGYSQTTADKQAASWIGKSRESSKKPHLYDLFQELLEARARQCWLDGQAVLEELARIGFARIGDYVEFTDGRLTIKDLESIPREAQAAIQEISAQPTKFGTHHKIKLHDKIQALVKLGQHAGLFKEQVEHSGPDGGPIEHRLEVPGAVKEKLDEIFGQG